MYGSWGLKRDWQNFVILDCFLPFYTPNNLKNQNFQKMKLMPGAIIILHMCTIYENHLMFGSLDFECDWQIFFSFWTTFCPFNNPKKSKFWKNEKNAWRCYHFTHVYHKWQSYVMYGSWDMEHDRQNILSFCTISCPFIPLKTRKIKI